MYRSYNHAGLISTERTVKDGKVTGTTGYEYEDGRIVSKKSSGSNGKEEWRYAYDEDGKVTREEYLKNGSTEKVTVYESGDSSFEELYRNGMLFARIHYQDGEKVKEDFFRNGQVFRTRGAGE